MFVYVQAHGRYKDQLPKGHKRKKVVYADTVREVLDYLKQYPGMKDLLDHNQFEVWVGGPLSKARNLTVEQAGDPRWKIPAGATIHITPHVNGHEITTAMLITALVTAAVSVAVTLLTTLLFPPPTSDTKQDRKSVLYQGGLNTQKEGIPLNYVAGLDVLAGSNIIEGDVEYVRGGSGSLDASSPLTMVKEASGEIRHEPSFGTGGGYALLRDGLRDMSSYKGGGGKTIRNTVFSDATLRVLAAYADGPVEGIIGSTTTDKEKNIYINELPLRDHGTGVRTYQGVHWTERLGEEGQSAVPITPKIANNIDANVELPKTLTQGGGQYYHEVLVTNENVTSAKFRVRVNALLRTDKKGNQHTTTIEGGVDVKRLSDASWTQAGIWKYSGKSTDPFVVEGKVVAPPKNASGETWMFRIYRTTADSTDDKLQDSTAFNGHVEYQDIELSYDGSANDVPTALFGIAIDLSQFDQGGNLPELAIRVAGRKVRVPSNYDPITRVYTGTWDGSWKTAATQNPIWHWFHLATNAPVGLGISETYFNKFALYESAKYCDGDVNGRPRFTLNKQFTDEKEGWPFLVELASSFRAFPYFNGTEVVLVQDRDVEAADHYVNNSMVEAGYFNYKTVDLSEQFNEICVEWDDPDDYFRKKVERYRDEANIARNKAAGLSNNGIISQTYYKVGCTNRQEAYDFARLLCYVSLNETEIVTFNTLVGAAAYAPGQLIAVDDVTQSGKKAHFRLKGLNASGKPQLDQTWTQKANTTYNAYVVYQNQLVIRPIVQVAVDTTHDVVDMDPTGVFEGMPCGVVEVGGVEPVWYRISDIQDAGEGRYAVTARKYARGKFAWVEQNIPPPDVEYTLFDRTRAVPAPTGLTASHSFEQDDLKGSIHKMNISWNADHTPGLMLQGYLCEVMGPDGKWTTVYEGPNTFAAMSNVVPGPYAISVKAVNTWNESSDVTSIIYNLEYGSGAGVVLPPTFIGFR